MLKNVSRVAGLLWLILFGVGVELGMLSGIHESPPAAFRRIEYVVPGYRIGYWLMSPP